MPPTWILVLASVLAVSALPLLAVPALLAKPERVRALIPHLVSFAVGALLGGAMLHLLPAAVERLGAGPEFALWFLGGFLGFFLLEKFLWTHEHHLPSGDGPRRPVVLLNLVGDGLHNFVDGMVIAASYIAAPSLGYAATLAVIAHEVSQEVGDFGILVHGGLSVRRAIIWNVISGLTALAGAGLILAVGDRASAVVPALLPLAAGGFVTSPPRISSPSCIACAEAALRPPNWHDRPRHRTPPAPASTGVAAVWRA